MHAACAGFAPVQRGGPPSWPWFTGESQDPAVPHPIPLYPPTLLPEGPSASSYDPRYDIYCSQWGCFGGVGGFPAKAWEQAWPTYYPSPWLPAAPLTRGCCGPMPPPPFEASPWLARYPQRRPCGEEMER
jgi:hypothetical protein